MPQADVRAGQQGPLLSQQEAMQQGQQLGAEREYAKQSSNLPPHSSFLPLSSTQPSSQTSRPSPVKDPHSILSKKPTDSHTVSSLSRSTTEPPSQLPTTESRSSSLQSSQESVPSSKEVTTTNHTPARPLLLLNESNNLSPTNVTAKTPTDSEVDSKVRIKKEQSPNSPENDKVKCKNDDENKGSEDKDSYEVTDEDVKRYLAFLNKPIDPLSEVATQDLAEEGVQGEEEQTKSEEGSEQEEEQGDGEEEEGEEDSEEEPDSPGLLTAMTFYDHSPGEVYTIHEDEEEASSPTASDGVSRPRRKGRVLYHHANLLSQLPDSPRPLTVHASNLPTHYREHLCTRKPLQMILLDIIAY